MFRKRRLKKSVEYDVIVVGGGPAGVSAAMAAGRLGVSVLLIEKTNCFGGMLTNGLVGMMRCAGDGGGIVREFWNRLRQEKCAEIPADTLDWADRMDEPICRTCGAGGHASGSRGQRDEPHIDGVLQGAATFIESRYGTGG